MNMVSATLLNPATGRGPWPGMSYNPARRGVKTMARRRRVKRGRGGRFVKAVRVRRGKRTRKARRGWPKGHRRLHRSAAAKGWGFRKAHRKGWRRPSGAHYAANPRRGRRGRRHNPFQIMGRQGSFGIVPAVATLKSSGIQAIGAVASDAIRATAYSFLGRNIGMSIAEDAVGRLVSGWLTGTVAGYVLGGAMAQKVYEGCMTVALYELAADAVAAATQGQPKVLGVIANPYTGRAIKPLLPSFSLGAPGGAIAGLGRVMAEGDVVPLGTVMPEGDIVPVGEDVPRRFNARF